MNSTGNSEERSKETALQHSGATVSEVTQVQRDHQQPVRQTLSSLLPTTLLRSVIMEQTHQMV